MFANSESLSDRSAEVQFRAVDPRTGRSGIYRTSVNQLLDISPTYDTAKQVARAILTRLSEDGLITRVQPNSLPAPRTGFQQWINFPGDDAAYAVAACPHDTRLLTGNWGTAPPFGGVGANHIVKPRTAIGHTQRQPTTLNGAPLPKTWDKWFPTAKLFSDRDYNLNAFIRDIEAMSTAAVNIKRSANAHPEFSPDLVCFNDGPQFPTPTYPPNVSIGTPLNNGVNWRHQYLTQHNWANMTRGAVGAAAGFRMDGQFDQLWRSSAWKRARSYATVRGTPAVGDNWSNVHVADAVADFMRFVNMLEFVLELGATGHVHAAAQWHNALYRKAQRELGIAPTANAEEFLLGLQREREAMRRRQLAKEDEGMMIPGAQMGLSEMGNAVLNGGVVASMQLFMMNPIAGGVAILLTAIAVGLIEWLSEGRPQQIPEEVPVRDGPSSVRSADENGDTRGDIFGGNAYPYTRREVLMGRPAIRVRTPEGVVLD